MSFCLRFVTKRDFDCEQVEQQTSQTELKQCLSSLTFRNHALSKNTSIAQLRTKQSLGGGTCLVHCSEMWWCLT